MISDYCIVFLAYFLSVFLCVFIILVRLYALMCSFDDFRKEESNEKNWSAKAQRLHKKDLSPYKVLVANMAWQCHLKCTVLAFAATPK